MLQIKFVEKLKTLCVNNYFQKIVIEPDRSQMIMAHAFCMLHSKASDTHSEYVLRITYCFSAAPIVYAKAPQYFAVRTVHLLSCVLCVQATLLQRIALGNTFERRAGTVMLMMGNIHENLHGK
jgi:hypothetical protein